MIRNFQPCDVVFFTPLKAQWNKNLLRERKNNLHEVLTKVHMAPILKIAIESDITVAINNSSKVTRLRPLSIDAVDYSKCKGHINDVSTETVCIGAQQIHISVRMGEGY